MDQDGILIVGINSFLGNAIYNLTRAKYSITGVYNNNKENIPLDIELIQVDSLLNLKNRYFKYIYLISSYIPTGVAEADEKLYQANILLPKSISELFPESRIIFCSSVSVYENLTDSHNISIDTKPAPESKYALSKLWGERIIEKHASYGIIRISSMYGVGMKTTTFVPKIIRNFILEQKVKLLGNGERMQNYIHVEDVANIAIKLAEAKQNITLLAVADQSYSNKDIAEMILDIIPGQIIYTGTDYSKSAIYCNATTHKILGKIKFKNIKEGLRELVEWSKKTF